MTRPTNIRRILKLALLNLAVFILLAVVLEVVEDVVLISRTGFGFHRRVDPLHLDYDAQLGWIPVPNRFIKDAYGPGIDVRINSQGLREDVGLSVEVPPKKIRLLCLGDSFTFGDGVNHDETWCSRLSNLLPKVQTANMGVSGYGLDQAYLRYKRDGNVIKHDFTLIAVITDDFRRMLVDRFFGYPKPKLEVHGDRLSVVNVPVPRIEQSSTWQELYDRLRLEELLLVRLYRMQRPVSNEFSFSVRAEEFVALLTTLVREFKQTAFERGSQLVIIWIPSYPDYSSEPLGNRVRIILKQVALDQLVWMIDLTEEFSNELAKQHAEFPIIRESPGAPELLGHYNSDGNKLIADILARRLVEIPELAALSGR